MEKCQICKCPMDVPGDPTTRNCGGDCLRCMALIGNDPDCLDTLAREQEKELKALRAELRALHRDTDWGDGSALDVLVRKEDFPLIAAILKGD